MSRIYDALKQTESSVVRLIEKEESQSVVNDTTQSPVAEALLPPDVLTDLHEYNLASVPELPPYYRTVEIQARAGSPVLPFDDTDQRTAECYRILRTNILHHPAKPKVFSITSAGAGEGKSTTAINLAGALALKEDSRILLIDADLRRGSVATMLGIDSSPGLAEVLTGQCRLEEAIVQTENLPNLHVLPAGECQANPTELLDSTQWKAMIQGLREKFQWIVVDTTPVGIVADYQLVHAVCDGTIMVVRPDFTDRGAYTTAIQHVSKGKLLGVLLNCVEDWLVWRTRDYYGHSYGNKRK